MKHLELKTYVFHLPTHWERCSRRGEGTLEEITITPCLVSPDGAVGGWSRAEIDVTLVDGAELDVDVAWDVDTELAETLEPVQELQHDQHRCWDETLPWDEVHGRTYRAADWPEGRPLRFPLHAIDSPRIWLRLKLRKKEMDSSVIRRLHVHYPNLSFDRYLPSIYREDPKSRPFVRGLMGIYESMFGSLENDLARLPLNIDPRTAPPEWVAVLIRWLGLPPAPELSNEQRKKLLGGAANLLRKRGTRHALVCMLRILVGDNFDVIDRGATARPWVLSRPERLEYGSRLGRDTLIVARPSRGPRLSQDFGLGGAKPLGVKSVGPGDLFAANHGRIVVRVALPLEERARLEPLLRRYLDVFVPAHCGYELSFVPQDELSPPQVLDEHARLYCDPDPRLGENTRLGTLRLPDDPYPEPRFGDDIKLSG